MLKADFPEFPWELSQNYGGIVGDLNRIWKSNTTGTDVFIYSAPVPNLSFCYDGITNWSGDSLARARLAGTGSSQHNSLAMLKAIAETAERYATSVLLDDEVIFASASDMNGHCFDPTPLTDCIAAERHTSNSKIADFDPDKPIRWLKGWCIMENRYKYVPAVMTHLFPRPQQSEMFWMPISTGVAAHTSMENAIIAAIGEVVERDAIALNWLTNRELPVIRNVELIDPEAIALYEDAERSDTQFTFLDATTDMGLPTVYTIETNDRNPKLTNVVACNSDFSWQAALSGSIRELASTRYAFEFVDDPMPETVNECVTLEGGARFMGLKERREPFEALRRSALTANMAQYDGLSALEGKEQINFLVEKIRPFSRDLVLVDLTTRDLQELGLQVVRAVIPGLVPMSTDYNYRYLGHPRLLSFAQQMVDPDFRLSDVNPWPQPFA